jgi:hypothetical protein
MSTDSYFSDYQEAVLEAYKKKKEATKLSTNLRYPTPAKLRDESVSICRTRFRPTDQKALEDFLGRDCSNAEKSVKAIQSLNKFDIEKFQPVINFLTGETKKPKEKIIEIAAWLIDFEKRPFNPKEKYVEDDNRIDEQEDVTQTTDSESPKEMETKTGEKQDVEQPGKQMGEVGFSEQVPASLFGQPPIGGDVDNNNQKDSKSGHSRLRRQILWALGILLPVTLAAYLFANKPQCMYWDEYQYRLVPCNATIEGKEIIASDAEKIKNLKKISAPDTITTKSIGKIWYVKTKKGDFIEFYTSDGFHPIEKDLQLKRITPYIINKYIDSIRNLKRQISK